MDGSILITLVIAILLGYWGSTIKKKKNRSEGAGWALGFFLGLIGIIICAVQDKKIAPYDSEILDKD